MSRRRHRRHLVRAHHVSGYRMPAHHSYEEYNPLGAAAKIGLAVVALGVVAGGIYYATKASAATTAAPAVPTSVQQTLNPNTSYTITVQSASDPSAALSAAGFQTTTGPALAGSGALSQSSTGVWTGNVDITSGTAMAVPAVSGVTWVSISPAA